MKEKLKWYAVDHITKRQADTWGWDLGYSTSLVQARCRLEAGKKCARPYRVIDWKRIHRLYDNDEEEERANNWRRLHPLFNDEK